MYTKIIKFERFLPQYAAWIEQSLRTTDDAVWLHLESYRLDSNIRNVVVMSI